MMVALTDEAHVALAAMLKTHAVDRHVPGVGPGHAEHRDFAWMPRSGVARTASVVDHTEGREAETGFRVRERDRVTRRCWRRPRGPAARTRSGSTSRRSAIRSSATGPTAGGGDDATALGLTRPFLHSWRIALVHPLTGERIEREEPLPRDLELALERARAAG